MNSSLRQIRLLLSNALRMDFRTSGGRRERSGRSNARPFVFTLIVYALMGTSTAVALPRAGITLHAQATLAYAVAGVMLVLNLLVEYQDILLAPTDMEVLGWRPIASRTLFQTRALHILFYVGILSAALLAAPTVTIGLLGEAGSPAACAAFGLGGLLSTLGATATVVLLYGTLLRRLTPERFQEVLGGVQIGFMLLIVVGYQLMAPTVLQGALGTNTPALRWWMWLPPAWYAAIPALVTRTPIVHASLWVAAGLVFLALAWGYAWERIAPAYQLAVESAQRGGSRAAALPHRASRLEGAIAAQLGRDPLRRAGFEFFLAQLRGDRRIRVSMMPLLALPIGFLIAALILGGAGDPYRSAPGPAAASIAGADSAPPAGADGSAGDAAAAPEENRAYWLLFYSVYMISAMAGSVGRTLGRSTDWRAAWVLRAAPLGRYDAYCSGVLWGVVYALLLPVAACLALLLLVAWHDPLHVAAHLALPLGLALLVLLLVQGLDSTPPFSEEPQRSARARDALLSFVSVMPFLALGFVQHALRARPLVLVGAGIVLGACAPLVWRALRPRIRISFRRYEFGG